MKNFKLLQLKTLTSLLQLFVTFFSVIKRTTASNLAVVFPFVMFCTMLLWAVDSLYYYIQFDNTQEKFWYEFEITDWFKLLLSTTTKYLENIVLPVRLK